MYRNSARPKDSERLRVAFFGTSDRSVPILETLQQNFDLALCVTKCDVRTGRHRELKECGVKVWAKNNGVPYIEIGDFQAENVKKVINGVDELKIKVGVTADFSFMVPQKVIDAFEHKILNIHFSLLPKYRGASPVQFAILNGDKETGITYYLMDAKMDTGNIVHQEKYALPEGETAVDAYKRLFAEAGKGLEKVINEYISGSIIPYSQDHSKATYTYSKSCPDNTHVFKDDAKIDWETPIESIYNSIRAYNPWPISWTTAGELEKKYLKNLHLEFKNNIGNKEARVLIFGGSMQEGGLIINSLQLEGARVMLWKDFKNGYLSETG